MSAQCEPTGACTAGVKVRITRQRTAGRFARPGDTDIAAGVTPFGACGQRFAAARVGYLARWVDEVIGDAGH